MALTQQQFDALVARLTHEAQTRPLWYKTRVFLLAMLGYAYVFGVLLVPGLYYISGKLIENRALIRDEEENPLSEEFAPAEAAYPIIRDSLQAYSEARRRGFKV